MKNARKNRIRVGMTLAFMLVAALHPTIGDGADIPDDTSIGTWAWDSSTPPRKIYTLNTDVSETIAITEDNVTLDGNGHAVAVGAGVNFCVYASGKANLAIQNLDVQNAEYAGIHLVDCPDPTLTTNTASGNGNAIWLVRCARAKVTANVAYSSLSGGIVLDDCTAPLVNRNSLACQGCGISIRAYTDQIVLNAVVSDNVISSTNGSWGILAGCGTSTFTANTVSGFNNGIYLGGGNENVFANNRVSMCNSAALRIAGSSGNTVLGNVLESCQYGLVLASATGNEVVGNIASYHTSIGFSIAPGSDSNTFTGNKASNNQQTGYSVDSSENTLTANEVSSNAFSGISIPGSSNVIVGNTISSNGKGLLVTGSYNEIYNNNLAGNSTQASVQTGQSGVPVGNVFSLDAPVGGNHWSNWTGPDSDGDGLVDVPYVFAGGQDDLPWVMENGWNMEPVQQVLDTIATVVALDLVNGIETSLDAKLQSALEALDDVNENNDVAAIGSLQAFINAVEAQQGKKISEADAADLIAKALNIIAILADD